MDINLKSYWLINKTKKYNHIFKMAVLGTENDLLIISGVNPDPVESIL